MINGGELLESVGQHTVICEFKKTVGSVTEQLKVDCAKAKANELACATLIVDENVFDGATTDDPEVPIGQVAVCSVFQ